MLQFVPEYTAVTTTNTTAAEDLILHFRSVRLNAAYAIARAYEIVSPFENILTISERNLIEKQLLELELYIAGIRRGVDVAPPFLSLKLRGVTVSIEPIVAIHVESVQQGSLVSRLRTFFRPEVLKDELDKNGRIQTSSNVTVAICAIATLILSSTPTAPDGPETVVEPYLTTEMVEVDRERLISFCQSEVFGAVQKMSGKTDPKSISSFQYFLEFNGFSPGYIDGVVGEQTLSAATEAAKSYGLIDNAASTAKDFDSLPVDELRRSLGTDYVRKRVPGCEYFELPQR